MATIKKTPAKKSGTKKKAASSSKKNLTKKPVQKKSSKSSKLNPELLADARTVVSIYGDDETAAAVAEEKLVENTGVEREKAAQAVASVIDELTTPNVDTARKLGLAQRRLNEVYKLAIQSNESAVALQAARELNRLECLYNKADIMTNAEGEVVDEEKEQARLILLKALNKSDLSTERLDDLARLLVFKYIEVARGV